MSKDFKIGDLVIVNEVDQPCGRLVAVVVGTLVDGVQDFCFCEYLNISKDLDQFNDPPMQCNTKEVTKLSEFGCVLVTNTSDYHVGVVGRSLATYPDGDHEHRRWQEPFPINYQGRPHLLARIKDNVFYEHF